MAQYVLQDLNVRDEFVSTSTEFLLYDEKVIVQSIWRLITTEEGEIPNFRVYGLSVKKYSQYPMTTETINEIYEYVKGRIATFEERGEIIKADVDASIENQVIYYTFYVRIRTTGTVVKLPTWTVSVGAA
jgi:phage baseplate assembly protein W